MKHFIEFRVIRQLVFGFFSRSRARSVSLTLALTRLLCACLYLFVYLPIYLSHTQHSYTNIHTHIIMFSECVALLRPSVHLYLVHSSAIISRLHSHSSVSGSHLSVHTAILTSIVNQPKRTIVCVPRYS